MPNDVTPARVRAIMARCDAATEGPWESIEATDTKAKWLDLHGRSCQTSIFYFNNGIDATFIAHSRADVPDLCRALEAAWGENERLRAELTRLGWERYEAEEAAVQAAIAARKHRPEENADAE